MKSINVALKYFAFMSVLLGVVYPAVLTGVSQVLFPEKANGSLVLKGGRVVGSMLLAQSFHSDRYFWPRPSAVDFNPSSSGATQLSLTSSDQRTRIQARRAQGMTGELLYASGSGLDPHLRPEDAQAQVARVAKARGWSPSIVNDLIANLTEGRQLGFLGEPRVNVLKLNLALDSL